MGVGVEIGDCASAGVSTKSSAKTMVAAAMAKGETLISRSMNGFMLLNLKPPRGKDVGYTLHKFAKPSQPQGGINAHTSSKLTSTEALLNLWRVLRHSSTTYKDIKDLAT